jgi:hypothetical protein
MKATLLVSALVAVPHGPPRLHENHAEVFVSDYSYRSATNGIDQVSSDCYTLYSRAVVAIGSDWLAFHVGALSTARTALLLPGPLQPKFPTAAATDARRALTISSPFHASPPALRDGMTHLWPFCRMPKVSSQAS